MSDRLCTKCDGRGFKKPTDGKTLTALAAIDRCGTCGGFGRVKDTPLIFYVATVTLLVVPVLIWALS